MTEVESSAADSSRLLLVAEAEAEADFLLECPDD
jgi:hypothetical protein